jgi:uncharacterized membrane protein
MEKKDFEKLKQNIPDVGRFARRHLSQTLTTLALLIGAFSAWKGFFVGGAFITLFFLAAGAALGIFLPTRVDEALKKVFQALHKKNKASEIVIGMIKIVMALFVPFVFFGFIGVFAGSAYSYYSRKAENGAGS